jgi:hypothetical protein
LDFENSVDFVIFLDWRDFDSDFDLCSFFGSDFESDLLEVFISLVGSDREDVFI